jgi:menaquinone-specific isochorismate synthase
LSIYWKSRDQSQPPKNATFHLLPFAGKPFTLPLKQRDLPPPSCVKVLKKTLLPEKKKWMQSVQQALDLIHSGAIEKVVLARACRLELEFAPDPFSITAALSDLAENSYVFCVDLGSKAFLGATPERLFAKEDRTLFSEAVAGTRKRSNCPIEDRQMQLDLLQSEKELSEFIPVQTYLNDTLFPFCQSPLEFSQTGICKTKNVQHLYSQCTASLLENISDETILSALHPTPALCGVPKEKAQSVIRQLESFDRGLYGGVIGWQSEGKSEWIVAIRSCLLEGNIATLYSGAGIVKKSDGEQEWEELNQKLKLYDSIFVH